MMVSSSLWCPTHITSVFSRLILNPCFLNTPFYSSNTSCSSYLLSAIMAKSSAYTIFLRRSTNPTTILPCTSNLFSTSNIQDILLKRYCLINSISGILSVELMMRYCQDNIGRYTIREMITYMNRTFRGCATGSTNIQ